MIRKIGRGIALGFGGLVIAGLLGFLFGLFVMLLWNWLMPTIFGLGEVTYWQAWGIAILAHLLFKAGGPGRMRGGRHGKHRGGFGDGEHKDREEWKDHFRHRFGHRRGGWRDNDTEARTEGDKGENADGREEGSDGEDEKRGDPGSGSKPSESPGEEPVTL